MSNELEKYLLEAAGKEKDELSSNNPYKEIGFDNGKKRLGWIKSLSFSKIKESLQNLLPIIEGKENFIFVGMGGSINGIKPLLSLFGGRQFYTLDSLDPKALLNVINKVKTPEKTLVVSISKSGTTKETQLLSLTLRELFSNRLGKEEWKKYFLWLSDPASFEKLDTLGWEGVKKATIQFNEETDIGGRFSSPHTLIFLLPLFLLLNQDLDKLKSIYESFLFLQEEIRDKAYSAAENNKNALSAYFSPVVERKLGESFSSWIIQLFQESLGSKSEDLSVKTLPNIRNVEGFLPLKLDLEINNLATSLISNMYFFQIFIAYYSAFKKVNFVNQNFVEKYKNQMRELQNQSQDNDDIASVSLDDLVGEVAKNINRTHRFIEIVLYFYPEPEVIFNLKERFNEAFREKQSLVFLGSDWNHQSYQAAFEDKNTFYVLLISSYKLQIPDISGATLTKNTDNFKLIAKATHLTLKDKSLLLSLQGQGAL